MLLQNTGRQESDIEDVADSIEEKKLLNWLGK